MNNYKHSQRGVALITGLLMLLIMSLIGIATMENSMVQVSLASNAELKTMSYQEAETVLKQASTYDRMVKAMDDSIGAQNDDDADELPPKGTITYCGALPTQDVRGLSLDANQAANSNSYTYYVFEITSDDVMQKTANSKHTQRNSQLMMAASDSRLKKVAPEAEVLCDGG